MLPFRQTNGEGGDLGFQPPFMPLRVSIPRHDIDSKEEEEEEEETPRILREVARRRNRADGSYEMPMVDGTVRVIRAAADGGPAADVPWGRNWQDLMFEAEEILREGLPEYEFLVDLAGALNYDSVQGVFVESGLHRLMEQVNTVGNKITKSADGIVNTWKEYNKVKHVIDLFQAEGNVLITTIKNDLVRLGRNKRRKRINRNLRQLIPNVIQRTSQGFPINPASPAEQIKSWNDLIQNTHNLKKSFIWLLDHPADSAKEKIELQSKEKASDFIEWLVMKERTTQNLSLDLFQEWIQTVVIKYKNKSNTHENVKIAQDYAAWSIRITNIKDTQNLIQKLRVWFRDVVLKGPFTPKIIGTGGIAHPEVKTKAFRFAVLIVAWALTFKNYWNRERKYDFLESFGQQSLTEKDLKSDKGIFGDQMWLILASEAAELNQAISWFFEGKSMELLTIKKNENVVLLHNIVSLGRLTDNLSSSKTPPRTFAEKIVQVFGRLTDREIRVGKKILEDLIKSLGQMLVFITWNDKVTEWIGTKSLGIVIDKLKALVKEGKGGVMSDELETDIENLVNSYNRVQIRLNKEFEKLSTKMNNGINEFHKIHTKEEIKILEGGEESDVEEKSLVLLKKGKELVEEEEAGNISSGSLLPMMSGHVVNVNLGGGGPALGVPAGMGANAWNAQPLFNGRLQLTPAVVHAMNQAMSIIKKYLPGLYPLNALPNLVYNMFKLTPVLKTLFADLTSAIVQQINVRHQRQPTPVRAFDDMDVNLLNSMLALSSWVYGYPHAQDTGRRGAATRNAMQSRESRHGRRLTEAQSLAFLNTNVRRVTIAPLQYGLPAPFFTSSGAESPLKRQRHLGVSLLMTKTSAAGSSSSLNNNTRRWERSHAAYGRWLNYIQRWDADHVRHMILSHVHKSVYITNFRDG